MVEHPDVDVDGAAPVLLLGHNLPHRPDTARAVLGFFTGHWKTFFRSSRDLHSCLCGNGSSGTVTTSLPLFTHQSARSRLTLAHPVKRKAANKTTVACIHRFLSGVENLAWRTTDVLEHIWIQLALAIIASSVIDLTITLRTDRVVRDGIDDEQQSAELIGGHFCTPFNCLLWFSVATISHTHQKW
jgi:hypothetical protein